MKLYQFIALVVFSVGAFVTLFLISQYYAVHTSGYTGGPPEVTFSTPKKTAQELQKSLERIQGQPTFIKE